MTERFNEQVMKAFAQRLRSARKDAGFAHAKDFSDALGVEPHRYRHWERGTAAPDLAMLTRICQLLNVEPNEFLPMALKKRPQASSERAA